MLSLCYQLFVDGACTVSMQKERALINMKHQAKKMARTVVPPVSATGSTLALVIRIKGTRAGMTASSSSSCVAMLWLSWGWFPLNRMPWRRRFAVPPPIKKILQSFRLTHVNNAVFVHLDAKVLWVSLRARDSLLFQCPTPVPASTAVVAGARDAVADHTVRHLWV